MDTSPNERKKKFLKSSLKGKNKSTAKAAVKKTDNWLLNRNDGSQKTVA